MKDLSGRFSEDARKADVPPPADPLARLHQPSPDDREPEERPLRRWFDSLRGRADLLAALCVALAAALVLWPVLYPPVVNLPAVAETGDEIATLTVRPLTENGTAAAPDWQGLFNAYALETSLRDISIRCAYGLAVDARTDRYLHARLVSGTEIKVFLADPGKCPKV